MAHPGSKRDAQICLGRSGEESGEAIDLGVEARGAALSKLVRRVREERLKRRGPTQWSVLNFYARSPRLKSRQRSPS